MLAIKNVIVAAFALLQAIPQTEGYSVKNSIVSKTEEGVQTSFLQSSDGTTFNCTCGGTEATEAACTARCDKEAQAAAAAEQQRKADDEAKKAAAAKTETVVQAPSGSGQQGGGAPTTSS